MLRRDPPVDLLLHRRQRRGSALAGKTLGEAGIAQRTGLNVVAIRHQDNLVANPTSNSILPAGATLLVIDDATRLKLFINSYAVKRTL